jgi:predicted nucleic acid-binding Zn ribbon protein
MATVRLPEHSHCKYCGDPIPFGEDYCGDGCRDADIQREKAEKKKDIMFYALSAVTVAVILAAGYLL